MYRIQTQSLKYYNIHDNGEIERLDIKHKPSENWRCLGFCKIKPFGQLGKPIRIAELLKERVYGDWVTFKNGKGKFKLIDFDHGTIRIWGDSITAIWEVNK